MRITNIRATNDCPDIVQCPSVDLVDTQPDRVYFIGKLESDPEILSAFRKRIGPDEGLFWQPADMHPEITA